MSDTEVAVVLTIASIVAGAVLGYLFFRLGSRDRRPVFMKAGNRVVAGGGPIEIRYEGVPVPRVTRTLVFFWNSGTESVRSEDVRNPVTLSVDDGALLRATIIRSTRDEINARLNDPDPSDIVLEFSHLDRGDGCCVEVLHTGTDPMGVSLKAVIVGVRAGPRFLASPFWDDPAGVWGGLVIGVSATVFAVGAAINETWNACLIASIAAMTGFRMASASRRRDKRYLPREFWDLQIPTNPSATSGATGWRLKGRESHPK